MVKNIQETIIEAREARTTPLLSRTFWSKIGSKVENIDQGLVRIAFCGTFTTQPLEPYLGTELMCHGILAAIQHAPYNQIHGELLSARSTLRTSPLPDVVVILWRMEELLSAALKILSTDPVGAREMAKSELSELLDAIRVFLGSSNASVIICNPVRPDVRPLGLLDARLEHGIASLHADIFSFWRRALADEARIHMLDLDGAQRDFGARQAANPKMWLLAKIPWSESFSQQVARQIARVVKSLKTPARKVLVMDCDNTLWGGVVGEDGVAALEIGEDAPGNAYVQLQRYALALRERGVLLALVSKNDEADVWQVFGTHPGMVLSREHIAAARINWLPKSQNLRQLAKDLNLGSDSFVFIDDSAAECAEVSANAPEVLTLHLSGDAAYNVRLIEESCAFDQLTLTQEDLQRAEMYVQEQKREALRTGVKSMEEYLAGLALCVSIMKVSEAQLGRVTQLINKTNQFNVTTIRRTDAEVRALWQDPSWHLFALSVTDRFGDYGLTGMAFCVERNDSLEIDTLVLSCRVLGRGVETALLAVLRDKARELGKSKLCGRFVPTSKNGLAATYYSSHGLAEVDGMYFWPTISPIPVPSHVTVNRSDPEQGQNLLVPKRSALAEVST